MTAEFSNHPTVTGARLWRRSAWGAFGSGFTLLLIVVLLAAIVVAAGALVGSPKSTLGPGESALAIGGFLVFIGVMAALSRLVWRDMRGKLGASIVLTDAGIALDLPPGRSLIHDPPRVKETIPWSNVKSIDTRLEMYGAQGMAMMNRVYRLSRRSGAPIFLFEQRGLQSSIETASLQPLAEEISARAGLRVRELGTFEGRGGILGAWHSAPPDWTAAPVTASRRDVLQRRLRFTGMLSAAVALLWLAQLFMRF